MDAKMRDDGHYYYVIGGSGGGGATIEIDMKFDAKSKNPVANSVITAAFNAANAQIVALQQLVAGITVKPDGTLLVNKNVEIGGNVKTRAVSQMTKLNERKYTVADVVSSLNNLLGAFGAQAAPVINVLQPINFTDGIPVPDPVEFSTPLVLGTRILASSRVGNHGLFTSSNGTDYAHLFMSGNWNVTFYSERFNRVFLSGATEIKSSLNTGIWDFEVGPTNTNGFGQIYEADLESGKYVVLSGTMSTNDGTTWIGKTEDQSIGRHHGASLSSAILVPGPDNTELQFSKDAGTSWGWDTYSSTETIVSNIGIGECVRLVKLTGESINEETFGAAIFASGWLNNHSKLFWMTYGDAKNGTVEEGHPIISEITSPNPDCKIAAMSCMFETGMCKLFVSMIDGSIYMYDLEELVNPLCVERMSSAEIPFPDPVKVHDADSSGGYMVTFVPAVNAFVATALQTESNILVSARDDGSNWKTLDYEVASSNPVVFGGRIIFNPRNNVLVSEVLETFKTAVDEALTPAEGEIEEVKSPEEISGYGLITKLNEVITATNRLMKIAR